MAPDSNISARAQWTETTHPLSIPALRRSRWNLLWMLCYLDKVASIFLPGRKMLQLHLHLEWTWWKIAHVTCSYPYTVNTTSPEQIREHYKPCGIINIWKCPKEHAGDSLYDTARNGGQLGAHLITVMAEHWAEDKAGQANDSKDKANLKTTYARKTFLAQMPPANRENKTQWTSYMWWRCTLALGLTRIKCWQQRHQEPDIKEGCKSSQVYQFENFFGW